MVTVEELYGEIWPGDAALEEELRRSLEPRPLTALYDAFAALGPAPGHLVVDVGCRDAWHAVELVRRFSIRVLAIDPVPLHVELAHGAVKEARLEREIEVVQAGIESLPLADEAAAFVWSRDTTTHVDLPRGLAECRRVLKPGGRVLLYQTFATDRLEPVEAARLFAATATVAANMDRSYFERTADEAGLAIESADALDGEWRESMVELGKWDAGEALLAISRLCRREPQLVERYGRNRVEAALANNQWGVYQLLGKLQPTIYVLRRSTP